MVLVTDNFKDELSGTFPQAHERSERHDRKVVALFFLHKSKPMNPKTIELLCLLSCLAVPSVAAFVVFAACVAVGRGKGYESKD